MPDAIETARSAIQERISEIEAERAKITAALSALTGSQPPRTPRRTRTTTKATNGRRTLAPRGQRREQLLAHLEKNPNSRPKDLAEALGVSSANVQNVIRSARKDGLIRKVRGGGYRLSKSAQTAAQGS